MPHAPRHIPLAPQFEKLAERTRPGNVLKEIPTTPMPPHFSAPFSGTLGFPLEQWLETNLRDPMALNWHRTRLGKLAVGLIFQGGTGKTHESR